MSNIKIIGKDEYVGIYELADIDVNGEVQLSHAKYDVRGGQEAAMQFSLISYHLKHLMGEVLTVAEATIDDERKLNATKSLIKDKFHAKVDWVYTMCGYPVDQDSGLVDIEEEV